MQQLGVEGRLVIAFTMAGGVMASGVLLGAASMAGGVSSGAVPSATCLLFVVGSVLGWVHAVLLGYTGRGSGTSCRCAVGHILLAGVWSLPTLVLALLVALGMSLSDIFVHTGGLFAIAMVAVAWVAGFGICIWAATVCLEAARNIIARYAEARLGGMLLGVLLLVLLFRFESTRPAIWGTEARVTGIGAAILALGVTIWFGVPVLFSILHLVYGRFPPRRKLPFVFNPD